MARLLPLSRPAERSIESRKRRFSGKSGRAIEVDEDLGCLGRMSEPVGFLSLSARQYPALRKPE
jgi:hypothetical protein